MFFPQETGRERQQNSDLHSVRGKAVVIVGGATDIGRATASLLAGRGARVLVTARDSSELSAVLKEVCHVGNEVHGMVVQLDRPDAVRRFFDEAERRLGGIDILVNHLAYGSEGSDPHACQNCCTEECIAHMQVRGRGHIINIGLPVNGELSASPTKMIPLTGGRLPVGMSAALRRQAGELGIRMTTIESGLGAGREPDMNDKSILPEDIARCVYDSIVQPFAELVLVKGHLQARTN
jgi:NADP-dependent 3-hydroxy acid dehydrogenase YdfG